MALLKNSPFLWISMTLRIRHQYCLKLGDQSIVQVQLIYAPNSCQHSPRDLNHRYKLPFFSNEGVYRGYSPESDSISQYQAPR